MIIQGHVKNGAIVPDHPVHLPDGVLVRIEFDDVGETAFWQNKTLDELAREQGAKPVTCLENVKGAWPAEESMDDFLNWLREVRK